MKSHVSLSVCTQCSANFFKINFVTCVRAHEEQNVAPFSPSFLDEQRPLLELFRCGYPAEYPAGISGRIGRINRSLQGSGTQRFRIAFPTLRREDFVQTGQGD